MSGSSIDKNGYLLLAENHTGDQALHSAQASPGENRQEIPNSGKIAPEPSETPPPAIAPPARETSLMATPAAPNQVWLITSKPSDENAGLTLKPITEFLGAMAEILWPLIFIVIVSRLWKKIHEVIGILIIRLQNPNTNIKIGPLELTVKNLQSEIKSLQEDTQALASVSTATSTPTTPAKPISEALRALSSEYKAVNATDWSERVRKKDELAGKMANLVIREGISREALAQDPDEGIKMALATVIHVNPQPGDDALITVAAPNVQLLNVRYRFMMAIARLAQLKLISADRLDSFKALCRHYRVNADESLNDRIDRTEAQIDALLTQP
jgi:hypothetical protein